MVKFDTARVTMSNMLRYHDTRICSSDPDRSADNFCTRQIALKMKPINNHEELEYIKTPL